MAPEDRKSGEIFRDVEPEDLLKYGLIPEFVGRLPVVATLEDLDEASLKLILTQPKNALVKQYQRLFEMESIDLTLAEEALGAIARKAIDRKTGARGLRSIMEGILLDTMFDLPSLEGVEEVVISKEVVEGPRPVDRLIWVPQNRELIAVREDAIVWRRAGLSPEALTENVGKDVADKLARAPVQHRGEYSTSPFQEVSGSGLELRVRPLYTYADRASDASA